VCSVQRFVIRRTFIHTRIERGDIEASDGGWAYHIIGAAVDLERICGRERCGSGVVGAVVAAGRSTATIPDDGKREGGV
jgi:hypothetical protein